VNEKIVKENLEYSINKNLTPNFTKENLIADENNSIISNE